MQVGIDVTFTHTNFRGHGLFSFGDIATLKNGQISMDIKKFNRSELTQKNHASRC